MTSLVLSRVRFLPFALGLTTKGYGIAAALGGAWFLWRAIVFLRADTRDAMARKLFFASIIYLPLVLGALVADRLLAP